MEGPSPHVRGKLQNLVKQRLDYGSIPARAGETPAAQRCTADRAVHPRTCGGNLLILLPPIGNTGPSPHVRGKQNPDSLDADRSRSIPARAGETSIMAAKS